MQIYHITNLGFNIINSYNICLRLHLSYIIQHKTNKKPVENASNSWSVSTEKSSYKNNLMLLPI